MNSEKADHVERPRPARPVLAGGGAPPVRAWTLQRGFIIGAQKPI